MTWVVKDTIAKFQKKSPYLTTRKVSRKSKWWVKGFKPSNFLWEGYGYFWKNSLENKLSYTPQQLFQMLNLIISLTFNW